MVQEYCSTSHPEPLLLATNEAEVIFHSDGISTDSGFQIYCSAEDRLPGCGGVYTNPEGQIRSPLVIEAPVSCEYEIKLSASSTINIHFQQYKLGADDCLEVSNTHKKEKNTFYSLIASILL